MQTESKGCHNDQAEMYEYHVYKDANNPKDYIRERYFHVLDKVIEVASLSQNSIILEIGIGTGLLTERITIDARICGIDISEKMMDKVKEKGLNVELKYGNFMDIPYEDNTFDIIMSTFAFHHLTPEEKQRAFIEMNRVLKSKGRIVIGDFMYEDHDSLEELINKFESEGRKDMIEELDDEYLMNIKEETKNLIQEGYQIEYQRVSTLSWVLIATKS